MTPAQLDAALADPRRKYGPPEYRHRVVPGMTRERLYREAFAPLAREGVVTGAEVGVADGRNALTLCQAIPGLRLICVDPWVKYRDNPRGGPQEQHDGNFAKATQRLGGYDATFFRMRSMAAIESISPLALDFVYIDGHHGFDYVMQDLIEWSTRIRPGGIVAGHDFYHFKWAGVVEAVDAYTRAHDITEWHLCDEREPSFWWVKP